MKGEPRAEESTALQLAGWAGFLLVVVLFLLVSPTAGMRGLGVQTLVWAGVLAVKRRIPYGVEGREPAGYITGVPALLLSLLFALIGVAMLVAPDFMLAMFGWDDE